MQEILLPGTTVLLERATSSSRSTGYTFVAAVHRGEIIALHSTRTNAVASNLVLPSLFDNQVTFRREASHGSSRFDFAARSRKGTVLVEVKSCTLCEHGVAMFPDAPSSRAARHVRELSQLVGTKEIAGGMVLFVIGSPSARVFMPNIHTDPEFSRALAQAKDRLLVTACSISVTRDGIARLANPDVPISFEPVRLVEEDTGVYLIVLFLGADKRVATGALGEIFYLGGWYVYIGSAKRTLSARVRRHSAKRKTSRWHIDYLSAAADWVRAYPIHTDLDLECELAHSIAGAGGEGIPRFGSSDCACASHLFWFAQDPFLNRLFVDTLFYFRHHRSMENFKSGLISRREP